MYKYPNNHSIDHVLVCGGTTEANDQKDNLFQMTLNGEYTDRLADGTVGVTEEMKEHADGGCSSEPICPICFELCNQGEAVRK